MEGSQSLSSQLKESACAQHCRLEEESLICFIEWWDYVHRVGRVHMRWLHKGFIRDRDQSYRESKKKDAEGTKEARDGYRLKKHANCKDVVDTYRLGRDSY